MRDFVLLAHDVPLEADAISLDDLSGSGGRLDAVSRTVGASLLTSHGIRNDTRVHVVVRDSVTIEIDGDSVRHLHPDERSTAALLRSAIEASEDAVGAMPVTPHPGIAVRKAGLSATIDRLGGPLIQLHEDGRSILEGVPARPVFVLSDHREFTEGDARALVDAETVSLGPTAMHAAHAVSVVHHFLDTGGYEQV